MYLFIVCICVCTCKCTKVEIRRQFVEVGTHSYIKLPCLLNHLARPEDSLYLFIMYLCEHMYIGVHTCVWAQRPEDGIRCPLCPSPLKLVSPDLVADLRACASPLCGSRVGLGVLCLWSLGAGFDGLVVWVLESEFGSLESSEQLLNSFSALFCFVIKAGCLARAVIKLDILLPWPSKY